VPGLTLPGQRRKQKVLIDPSGGLVQFATEGTGVTHVRRSLVAYLAAALTVCPLSEAKTTERVVVDRQFLERVEDLTDVVIAFR
jgi:hypothetical protein